MLRDSRNPPRLRRAAAAVCSLALLTGCAAGAKSRPDTAHADRQGPTGIGTDSSAESRVTAALCRELLTDPVLTRDRLVVLTDPEGVIPPEHVFPLIQAPYMGLAARRALARVNAALTTDQLAALASAVDAGRSPTATARTWLRSQGLLG